MPRRLETLDDLKDFRIVKSKTFQNGDVVYTPLDKQNRGCELLLYGVIDHRNKAGQPEARIRVRPGSKSLSLLYQVDRYLKMTVNTSAIGEKRQLQSWTSPLLVHGNGHVSVNVHFSWISGVDAFDLDGQKTDLESLKNGTPVAILLKVNAYIIHKTGGRMGGYCMGVQRVHVLATMPVSEFLRFIQGLDLSMEAALSLPSSTANGIWTTVYNYAVDDPTHRSIDLPPFDRALSNEERLSIAFGHIAI